MSFPGDAIQSIKGFYGINSLLNFYGHTFSYSFFYVPSIAVAENCKKLGLSLSKIDIMNIIYLPRWDILNKIFSGSPFDVLPVFLFTIF